MILKKLTEFLDGNQVKYVVITHSQAFTAQEIAAVAHIPGKEIAKTVMVKLDGAMTMAVIPASDMVDFKLLKQLTGCAKAELASEKEFGNLFPNCEIGAMPPFGNLFDLRVVVSDRLAEDEKIAFNAGTHRELVQMSYADFARLVQPTVSAISIRKRLHDGERIFDEQ